MVAAYSSDGQMLTSDLYSWTGTELTFTVPEGDLIQVFFLDSNWSPLRPQIPI